MLAARVGSYACQHLKHLAINYSVAHLNSSRRIFSAVQLQELFDVLCHICAQAGAYLIDFAIFKIVLRCHLLDLITSLSISLLIIRNGVWKCHRIAE